MITILIMLFLLDLWASSSVLWCEWPSTHSLQEPDGHTKPTEGGLPPPGVQQSLFLGTIPGHRHVGLSACRPTWKRVPFGRRPPERSLWGLFKIKCFPLTYSFFFFLLCLKFAVSLTAWGRVWNKFTGCEQVIKLRVFFTYVVILYLAIDTKKTYRE